MKRTTLVIAVLLAAASLTACGNATEEQPEGAYEFFPEGSLGKGDMADKAHIVGDIKLRSQIDGAFRQGVRVYGYTFEAKAGATVNAHVRGIGGESSVTSAGEDLDMIMGLYGPMDGDEPGPQLAYVDQSDKADATLEPVELEENGRYLIVFSTWDDPAGGKYDVELGCEGTNFQCRQPIADKPCEDTIQYIEGDSAIEGNTTWSACEVVLLESTTIGPEVNLTIEPGVTVKGNFIAGEAGEPYGIVNLTVEGRLQAEGTKENPIVFTSFKEDKGWDGLKLLGSDNHIEHAYVENARVGIYLSGGKNNTLRHLDVNNNLEGLVFENEASASLEDLVVTAPKFEGERRGNGIKATNAAPSKFVRSYVTGYDVGVFLNSSEFEFVDSTFTGNNGGIFVTGPNSGLVKYPFECPEAPRGNPAPSQPVWTPSNFGRDPIFTHCDIIGNSEYGLHIDAPELLVVEKSNVKNNGKGIEIKSTAIHPESRINQNNIYGNGDNPQVESWHASGTLDISDNYWDALSDPELSASWDSESQTNHTCEADVRSHRNPAEDGWTCQRVSRRSNSADTYRCTQTITPSWVGDLNYTGFSPTEFEDAGPRPEKLTDPVQQARQQSGL